MNRDALLATLRERRPKLFEGNGEAFIGALSDAELRALVEATADDYKPKVEETPPAETLADKKKKAKKKSDDDEAMKEAIAGSFEERMSKVSAAVRSTYGRKPGTETGPWVYACYTFSDRVVYQAEEKDGVQHYSVDYTINADGAVEFTSEPVKVEIVQSIKVKESAGRVRLAQSADDLAEDCRFVAIREGGEATGAEWDVVIIQEGLSANRNYYSRAVLEAAAPKYEKARIYIDHDDAPGRFGRPSSSLAGFLKNVQPVMIATKESQDAGVFALGAIACITKKAVREELMEAHRLGNPELYGLSHDIKAKHQTFIADDKLPAVLVEEIRKVDSVDIVTNPAAGGRVSRLVASDTQTTPLQEDGRMLEQLIARLRALNRPDLIAKLGATPTETQALEALDLALSAPAPASGSAAERTTPLTETTRAANDAMDATLLEARTMVATMQVETDLRECALPEPSRARLRKRFTEQITAGQIPTRKQIADAIADRIEEFGALAEAGVILPGATATGAQRIEIGKAREDKVRERIADFFDPAKPATSFREMYVEITGDAKITGRLAEAPRLRESLTSTSFDQALGDSITRRMLTYYATPDYANWRLVARTVPLQDFRTQRRIRFGGYPNLPIVNQGQAYGALTSPTDEEATYSPAKRGGTEAVTLEMIRNDDVGVIREIPMRLGRAAAQTLYEFVLDFMATNAAIYDSTALAAAGHGNNLVTTAMSPTNINVLRLRMKNQTDMSSGKRLGLRAKYLWVPNDLEEFAFEIATAVKKLPDTGLAAQAEPAAPNFLRERIRLEVQVVDYWTDTNNYWLTASSDQTPLIEVGFLDGQETPEVFVQDMPNVGSMFNSDQLIWKLRHIYGGAVMDFRGFGGGIVA